MNRFNINPFNRFCELVQTYNWSKTKTDHIYSKEIGYYGHLRRENGCTHNYVYCYIDKLDIQLNLISLTIFENCFLLNNKKVLAYNQDILSLVNPHNMANPNSPWEAIVRRLVRFAGEDFDRLVRQ